MGKRKYENQNPRSRQPAISKDLVQRSMTKPELPQDMIEEILCRVPATDLKRLRPTCKAWSRLFKDDWRFAREHCEKAVKEMLILMLTKESRICPILANLHGPNPCVEVKNELSLPDPHSSFQFDVGLVFQCDGLLLCLDDYCRRIVVWNPFTGGTRWIEDDRQITKGCASIALGYSRDKKSCSKSYKLLSYRLSIKIAEIYEFNSDSWRIVDHDIAPGWSIGYSDQRVSLKGNIYWFGRDTTKTRSGLSLLGFDFSTERCGHVVPLPYQRDSYVTVGLSVVGEEKLSVLLRPERGSKTEIWVTNKIDETNKVVSWSKVLALDSSLDLQITSGVSFLLDEEKKVILLCKRWFDMEDDDKSIDKLHIVGEDNKVTSMDFGVDTTTLSSPFILNYVPSLAQIERAQIKRAGCKRKRAH